MTRERLFNSILCPTDFSAPSKRALQYAGKLASRAGGELTVLYVGEPFLIAAAEAAAYDARKIAADTQAKLERFAARAFQGRDSKPRKLSCLVSKGNPADEIDRVGRSRKCDLIVIGAHGLTGPAKVLLGSTTERLLQHTRIPTLVIPAARKGRAEA
jgi:nucleotide-binding universal stress UspA family protein